MRILKSTMVLAAVLAFAVPVATEAKGLREGPPSGVTPPGDGPIPKGKSDVVDDVLKYNGWEDCGKPWGGTYLCSPKKKR